MKKIIKSLSVLPVLALLAVSCYEDKGNYDYTDVKEATITFPGIEEGQNVLYNRLGILSIDPEITYGGAEASTNYTYRWTFYPDAPVPDPVTNLTPPAKLIGEEKKVEYTLVDAPGKYHVVLETTNKQTGALAYSNFTVTVSGAVVGWLVLYEDADGKGDLGLVRDPDIVAGLADGLTGAAYGLYSGSNNGAKMTDAKFLAWRHRLSPVTYNNVYIYTSTGYYKTNALGLDLKTTNYQANFGALTKPSVFKPQAMFCRVSGGVQEVLINDGSLFSINWQTMGISNDQYRAAGLVNGVEVKVHPFIASTMQDVTASYTGVAVTYDDTTTPKGSFVVGAKGTYVLNWSRPSIPNPTSDPAKFNPAEVNSDGTTEMKLAYLGTGRDGTTCAIFKDAKNGNKPWLYHADFRVLLTPSVIGRYDISALTGITSATQYEFGVRGDVLFYASGNHIYSATFPTGTATSLLTLGADETVAQIKLYNHGQTLAPYNPNPNNHGRILFVATNSPSGGKVYKIKFNELNGQLDGTPVTFTGFGKILDMTNKAI